MDVTPEQLEVFKRIDKLDLEPCICKYIIENGWVRQYGAELSKEFGLAVARQYRSWLKLRALGHRLPPLSREMDNFWHTHILDTEKYADDCNRVFGYFLHHFPYSGLRGDEDAETQLTAQNEMKKLYREVVEWEAKHSVAHA